MAEAKKEAKVELTLADTAEPASVIVTKKDGTTDLKTGDDARKMLADALNSPPTPEPLRQLAEKLPEKDEVQKAHKDAMLAETPAEEVSAKVRIVEASPNADETPSGKALQAVEGITDPIEAGEKYQQVKSAVRHGTAQVDVS